MFCSQKRIAQLSLTCFVAQLTEEAQNLLLKNTANKQTNILLFSVDMSGMTAKRYLNVIFGWIFILVL